MATGKVVGIVRGAAGRARSVFRFDIEVSQCSFDLGQPGLVPLDQLDHRCSVELSGRVLRCRVLERGHEEATLVTKPVALEVAHDRSRPRRRTDSPMITRMTTSSSAGTTHKMIESPPCGVRSTCVPYRSRRLAMMSSSDRP